MTANERFLSMPPLILSGMALCLWMSLIFWFSSLPGSNYLFDPPFWYVLERKSAHVFEFTVLMILAVRFIADWFSKESYKRILLLAGVFSLAFAVSDELHQFFVPHRGAKIADVVVDAGGILLIAGVLFILEKWKTRKRVTSE